MTDDLAARADLAEGLVPVAVRLIGSVYDYDSNDVAAALLGLSQDQLRGLAVVLAAMVDLDRSPRDLLSWVKHGTNAGYYQHLRDGEPTCSLCRRAHSAARAARRRAARAVA